MNSRYVSGQVNAPAGYTKPKKSFTFHVLLAMLALLAFVAVYLGLMIWFGKMAYGLFELMLNGGEHPFFLIVVGGLLSFLSVFMFKSLFIFSKNKINQGQEVKQEEEPVLFDYLYGIADEIGAPRPHKVYISHFVSAAVSYDLNIFNLLIPYKKNLHIGLGLVNMVNTGEFKSILAHEFGHFAQRSMLLGRYVYVAQQIAIKIVHKRDALDDFLAGLSSIDLRVAWIGWILSILVWAMRALIQTLFSVVSLAERALSKEMEFQADIVAVSLTGSDALIQGLHKLRAADEAFGASLDEVDRQLKKGKAVPDLFTLQTNFVEQVRVIRNDSSIGDAPIGDRNASFRVFDSGLVNPPQMWETHPSDNEREENAKRDYLYAEIDTNSAWDLFKDPKEIREKVTADLIKSTEVKTERISMEESLNEYNEIAFNWQFLKPKYKAVYADRFPFLNFSTVKEAYDFDLPSNQYAKIANTLYSDEFAKDVEQLATLEQEIILLTRVQNEVLTVEKRSLMHRGKTIKRRNIPSLIKKNRAEEVELRRKVSKHDKLCRKLPWEIAHQIDPRKASYLTSVAELVHYAEHTYSDLSDSYKKYVNVFNVVVASGRVSNSDLNEFLKAANSMHKTLRKIYVDSTSVKLNKAMKLKMEVEHYKDLFEDFKIQPATAANVESWTQSIDGWIDAAFYGLDQLRHLSLEHLLQCEEELIDYIQAKKEPVFELEEVRTVESYKTLLPGTERKLQWKLSLWDRFHAADGLFGSVAKFLVSGIMIFGTVYLAFFLRSAVLYVYNGLDIPVKVKYEGRNHIVRANESADFRITGDGKLVTSTEGGEVIESFIPETSFGDQNYVYNVANASVLIAQTAFYGYEHNVPDEILGNARWSTSNADFIFEPAPSSIEGSSSGGTRDVLYAVSTEHPFSIVEVLDSTHALKEIVLAHATWDAVGSPYLAYWFNLAISHDTALTFAKNRISRSPGEVISYRLLMDRKKGEELDEVYEKINKNFKSDTNSANFFYLNARMQSDKTKQDLLFIEGMKKWPDNRWISMAAGYTFAKRRDWMAAYEAFANSMKEGVPDAQPYTISVIKVQPESSSNKEKKYFIELYAPFLERIRRYQMLYDKNIDQNYDILDKHPLVEYYRKLESNDDSYFTEPSDVALEQYCHGEFQEALATIKEDKEIQDRLKRMMVFSNKTIPAIEKEVLEWPADQAITASTIWPAIALQMKHKKDYSEYVEQLSYYISLNDENKDTVYKALNLIASEELDQAGILINELDDFMLQARMLSIVMMLYPDEIPDEWKKRVEGLLFQHERPYLGK